MCCGSIYERQSGKLGSHPQTDKEAQSGKCIYTVPYGTSQEEVNRDESRANRRAKIGNKLKEGKKRKEKRERKWRWEGGKRMIGGKTREETGLMHFNRGRERDRERESEMEDSD